MRCEIFGEIETKSKYAILLPNHWASSIDDASGDRAQYLTETLHVPVLAFERPSTATLKKQSTFTVESYLEDADNRAQELQKQLDEFGIEKGVITSNSAGALDSLVIAATGKVAIARVVAIEPVGMRQKTFSTSKEAINYFGPQIKSDKTDIDSDEFRNLTELKDIRERSDVKMGWRMLTELRAYWRVYSSDIGMRKLRELSINNPDMPVNLILGDNSTATTLEQRASMTEEFKGSSVKIEFLKAGHSFVDRHHYFLHIVQKAIESAPNDISEPDLVVS